MLKKQTVWLLTMLSLMIVLSVYYMTSPDSGEIAYVNQGEGETSEETSSDPTDETNATEDTDADVNNISNVGEDQLFTTIRMELQDERSEMKDQLDDVVASSTASVEEKNEARNEMNEIDELSRKESLLEDSIVASAGYSDVLVRNEDEIVHVHVKKAEELSKSEVVNIMQMVRDEFGDITVDVRQKKTEG